MAVRIVEDPVGDPRCSELLERHPDASVFHTPGWLSALQQTYGYEPFVVTTSPRPVRDNGLVLRSVKGSMARWRVSLRLSDHCGPLLIRSTELFVRLAYLTAETQTAGWRSLEVRPLSRLGQCGLSVGGTYCMHRLDLRPQA